MYSFNIILTTICNARCSHCYMKTNENPKTLSHEEIDILINKLPNNTKTIIITGGEIFCVREELEYFIKKINKKYKNIQIGLESNGIYLYNHNALKILKNLKKLNVDFIRLSDDSFHEKGGVDLSKVRKLKKLESKETPIIKYLVQTKALSIGKAELLNESKKSKPYCMNKKDSIKNPYIFMDIDGDMYICAWKSGKKIGNIFADDFSYVESNLKGKINHCILTGNIIDAIILYKNEEKQAVEKFVNDVGECNACIKTFINNK